jgi:hypothetical protein
MTHKKGEQKSRPALAQAKRREKQKLSISLDAALLPELAARGEERSAVLSRDLARYYALLREARVALRERLTPAELSAILDVQNGHWYRPGLLDAGEIWANVEDGCRLDGLDKKWGIDGAVLVEKLKVLSPIEVHALADATERFWESVSRDEKPEIERALD